MTDESRKLNIAILADYFLSWMGGAQLLANIVNALQEAARAERANLEILCSAAMLGPQWQMPAEGAMRIAASSLNQPQALSTFIADTQINDVVFYQDLRRTVQMLGIDVVGPTGMDLGADFPVPWLGYVPDFQHQQLPKFFSQNERLARDKAIRQVIENCDSLFLTSHAATADAQRFYGPAMHSKRRVCLPPAPPRLAHATPLDVVADRYSLTRPFLICCSQRWIHKQHDLIVKAFAELVQLNPQLPVELVFTGQTSDYRWPGYEAHVTDLIATLGLTDRVHVLGMVPRADQLGLIELSLGLVQASRFEGNPGAGGVIEAALLGTPILASNIDANLEIATGQCTFFDVDDPRSLSVAMGHLVSLYAHDRIAPRAQRIPYSAQAIHALQLASGLNLLGTLRSMHTARPG